MYCKKCNTLMEDGKFVCDVCGYDNSEVTDTLEETKEININPPKFKLEENKTKVKKSIIILLIILIIGGASFYIINDSKSIDESIQKSTKNKDLDNDKTFTLNKINFSYPSSLFGASKSTIFYKDNNAYNIEIKEISMDEYTKKINNEFKDESSLNNIKTNTSATEKKYEHILAYQDSYYSIVVNYLLDETLESTKIQLEMTKIINSIHFN